MKSYASNLTSTFNRGSNYHHFNNFGSYQIRTTNRISKKYKGETYRIQGRKTSDNRKERSRTPKITEKRREAAEKRTSKCSHYFGYLKNLPKNSPFPDECLGCRRIVECLLKKEELNSNTGKSQPMRWALEKSSRKSLNGSRFVLRGTI